MNKGLSAQVIPLKTAIGWTMKLDTKHILGFEWSQSEHMKQTVARLDNSECKIISREIVFL